jgi:hypothetical protein
VKKESTIKLTLKIDEKVLNYTHEKMKKSVALLNSTTETFPIPIIKGQALYNLSEKHSLLAH